MNLNSTGRKPQMKLMVSGRISLTKHKDDEHVIVRRGMPIYTREGLTAARVTAVVVDSGENKITHLVLDQLPESPDYRLLPINRIRKVDEEGVHADLSDQEIERLEHWRSN